MRVIRWGMGTLFSFPALATFITPDFSYFLKKFKTLTDEPSGTFVRTDPEEDCKPNELERAHC